MGSMIEMDSADTDELYEMLCRRMNEVYGYNWANKNKNDKKKKDRKALGQGNGKQASEKGNGRKSLGHAWKPALGVGMCVSRSRLFFTKPSNKLGGSRKSLAQGNGPTQQPSNNKQDTKSLGSEHSLVLTDEDIDRLRRFYAFHNHDLCKKPRWAMSKRKWEQLGSNGLDDCEMDDGPHPTPFPEEEYCKRNLEMGADSETELESGKKQKKNEEEDLLCSTYI